MKITKVAIRRGATINMGNYESARVDVELTADVEGTEGYGFVVGALASERRARSAGR